MKFRNNCFYVYAYEVREYIYTLYLQIHTWSQEYVSKCCFYILADTTTAKERISNIAQDPLWKKSHVPTYDTWQQTLQPRS
jgi:hypothetical protein